MTPTEEPPMADPVFQAAWEDALKNATTEVVKRNAQRTDRVGDIARKELEHRSKLERKRP